eukprot:CAMPEP_0195282080 /NCGR_PEP_ID=MMETSP0707-20130614/1120_1 /TAXON_ID=33640 /ORGANISM="Asterionellopsis glacialis, Strain CCMP134" /LENGTH=427 /DNA_ID=CAMNT_0040341031 /DNA_START=52 /DNA_END=1335 /DNA_ORIENTATION=+
MTHQLRQMKQSHKYGEPSNSHRILSSEKAKDKKKASTKSSTLDLTRKCSAAELKTIHTHLPSKYCYGVKTKKCSIREATKCPVENWLTNYIQARTDIKDSFLGMSIGCNKGDDAIDTARMSSFNETYDHEKWLKALGPELTEGKMACGENSNHFVASSSSKPKAVKKIEMHCIEPMPDTANALKGAAASLQLDTSEFVITQAAVSLSTGTAFFPTQKRGWFASGKNLVGAEDQTLASCEKNKAGCTEVPLYSMDDYVDKFVKSDGPIHILGIDAQGYDFDVMKGGSKTLDRTEFLEFEYDGYGNWIDQNLNDAIDMLDEKGFSCYWAGHNKLWRITGCWQDYYGRYSDWSNIACVHRERNQELGQIMEQTFEETLKSTDPPYEVKSGSSLAFLSFAVLVPCVLFTVKKYCASKVSRYVCPKPVESTH